MNLKNESILAIAQNCYSQKSARKGKLLIAVRPFLIRNPQSTIRNSQRRSLFIASSVERTCSSSFCCV